MRIADILGVRVSVATMLEQYSTHVEVVALSGSVGGAA